MAQNINVVVITGNLTRDPELKHTPGGTAVCNLGVAVNGRKKDSSGEWVDDPNFFDVTVWGSQGENCAQYLAKGRPVAIKGRLDWRSWEHEGQKRSKVEIVAESVQFLNAGDGQRSEGSPSSGGAGTSTGGGDDPGGSDFGGPTDDDIPF